MPDGRQIAVTDVLIVKRNDHGIELTLEDGSIVKVMNPVVYVSRMEGEFDNFGNPQYFVQQGTLVVTVEADELYRKPKQGEKPA